MELFARRLRERARELGLTDAEVARRSGLLERRYAHYVAGRREPDFATLMRICRSLGVTPDALFAEQDAVVRADLDMQRVAIAFGRMDSAGRHLAVGMIEMLADAWVRPQADPAP